MMMMKMLTMMNMTVMMLIVKMKMTMSKCYGIGCHPVGLTLKVVPKRILMTMMIVMLIMMMVMMTMSKGNDRNTSALLVTNTRDHICQISVTALVITDEPLSHYQ